MQGQAVPVRGRRGETQTQRRSHTEMEAETGGTWPQAQGPWSLWRSHIPAPPGPRALVEGDSCGRKGPILGLSPCPVVPAPAPPTHSRSPPPVPMGTSRPGFLLTWRLPHGDPCVSVGLAFQSFEIQSPLAVGSYSSPGG